MIASMAQPVLLAVDRDSQVLAALERDLTRHFFVLIGADPHSDWLADTVERDSRGFLVTGSDLVHWPLDRPPLPQETSTPGVFAAGDVRHGSVKRVASAVGEGAAAIQQIHHYLATS